MGLNHNEGKRSFTAPAGTAKFPHLNTPDTKYDEDGVYKVDIVMDSGSSEAQELIALIDNYVDEAVEEKKGELKPAAAKKLESHTPYFMEEDDEGEQTGRVVFRFKANYQFKDQKTGNIIYRTITMFDAKGGKPLKNPPFVRGGSVLKIASKISNPWYNPQTKSAGVTLYIQAVQILELGQGGGGGDASGFGFGEEEDFDGVGESESEAAGFTDDDDDADPVQDDAPPNEGEGDF